MRADTVRSRALILAAALVSLIVATGVGARGEQSTPPPIQGVTGTIATEETRKDVHRAGRGVFGKVARLFGWTGRDSAGEDAAGDEIFAGLAEGAAVVLQDGAAGTTLTAADVDRRHDRGVKQDDGVITAVNRGERTITVRLADGTRETLRFAGRADGTDTAGERSGGATVIVVVKDAAGERIVLFFSRVS